MSDDRELLLLKFRNAIASKEFVIAKGNSDLGMYGKWQSDYQAWMNDCNLVIEDIWKELDNSTTGHDSSADLIDRRLEKSELLLEKMDKFLSTFEPQRKTARAR